MARKSPSLSGLDDDTELLMSSLSFDLPKEKSFSEKEAGKLDRVYL